MPFSSDQYAGKGDRSGQGKALAEGLRRGQGSQAPHGPTRTHTDEHGPTRTVKDESAPRRLLRPPSVLVRARPCPSVTPTLKPSAWRCTPARRRELASGATAPRAP